MLILKPQQTACALDCLRADRIVGWEDRPLTAIDELVWRTLYFNFMNKKTGACWPSIQTIADVAGCCRRTACTSIQRLRKAGWLRWDRRRIRLKKGRWTQAPNEYELRIPRRWRRTVSECKPCARTTGIFIKIAAGHLMRPKRVPPKSQPERLQLPPNFGHNHRDPDMDPELQASLDRLGMRIQEKHERELAQNAIKQPAT